jgi:hypothetical protein
MVGSSQEGGTTTSMVIIAIIVALGVIGVVAITIFVIQPAEAKSPTGQCASTLKNGAAQFCHRIG